MLELTYVNDSARLCALYSKQGVPQPRDRGGINVVFIEDGEDIGLSLVRLDGSILTIESFALELGKDDFGNVDFFFRALLFKLGNSGLTIRVNAIDERLYKFGFQVDNQGMSVPAERIAFPSKCGCNDD